MSGPSDERRILVGVTGASGSCYAEGLIAALLEAKLKRVYIVATDSGKQVADHELSLKTSDNRFNLRTTLSEGPAPADRETIRVFKNTDLFAPIASGSSAPTDMVIVPCSMGTLSRVAHATSSNLLERSADVVLKQRRRLVIVPRETPLHAVHLQNMLTLTQMGAIMVPPTPGFYQKPDSVSDMVDFVVGKILEVLEIQHSLYPRWNSRMV